MPRRFKLICALKEGEECALSDSQVFGRLQITFRFSRFTLLEQMSWVICGSIYSLWCPSVQNGKEGPLSKEVEFSSWHRSPCRLCKLRLWPPFVSALLSLIIFSGHWILTFLLCRVFIQWFWHRRSVIPEP